MNLFKKQDQALLDKIASYETHVSNLETELASQSQKIESLISQVESLVGDIAEKSEVIESKEEVLETLQDTIKEQEAQLEAKEEIIQEVIDNTMTVEKLAAIKASEILAECGTQVVETIADPEELDIMAQMKKLHGQELQKFYQEHKLELFNKLNKSK